MSIQNLVLYLLEHNTNSLCVQWLDKVTMDPPRKDPAETIKCTEWYFLNLALPTQDNRAQDLKIQILMTQ